MTYPLIIYDGECSFCNNFLKLILKNDDTTFKIVDRTSKLFDHIKEKYSLNDKNGETIYLLDEENVYQKSTAIIKILLKCKPQLKVVAYFILLIPKPIRDFGYSKFSKYRRIFFSKNHCSITDRATFNNRLIQTL